MTQYDFDTVIDRYNSQSFKWDGAALVFGRSDLLPMWVADQDFAAPPEVVEAIQQRAAHGIYGYTLRPHSFYQAICQWQKKRFGWDLEKEWLCFTPGVVPAVGIAIQAFTQPGDGVLLQTPVYNAFFPLLQANGRRLVSNPLVEEGGRYRIDWEDLRRKLKETKLIILTNPHNPVGRVWERAELDHLLTLCLEAGVLVLSDEIHEDIVFPGNRHIPFATLSSEAARVSLTCIAPSKTFNVAGLASSVVIIPDLQLRRRFQEVLEGLELGMTNLFGLVAMEACYRHGKAWLEELMGYLAGNLACIESFLAARLPGVKMIPPEGTYLAWLDCRSLRLPQEELDQRLVDAGLGLSAGTLYGPQGEGFQRLNFACPRLTLKEGLSRLEVALG